MAEVLESAGYEVEAFPMSDGGEGLLEVLGGANRSLSVTGANGGKVVAGYRLDGGTAIIEMAAVAGLSLVGGAEHNDAMAASTRGVGELIKAAVFAGAKTVIVGCGGSATTDGGLGALEALEPVVRLKGIELVAAVDVEIVFREAAKVFAPQKGASMAEVRLLTQRLEALEKLYLRRFGVDISSLKGGGAAGGLAGGLAAIGARIVSGFDVVSERLGLHESVESASLIVTGEGYLDWQSFNGKVVGRIVSLALDHSVPYLVLAGDCDPEVRNSRADCSRIFSLVAQVGEEKAFTETLKSVEFVLASALRSEL
ncbi:MAG: glycerate kinase [Actinomycetota bacterium]|nr:MAG: glycerate kinase [Actinomycetota bacterium]